MAAVKAFLLFATPWTVGLKALIHRHGFSSRLARTNEPRPLPGPWKDPQPALAVPWCGPSIPRGRGPPGPVRAYPGRKPTPSWKKVFLPDAFIPHPWEEDADD